MKLSFVRFIGLIAFVAFLCAACDEINDSSNNGSSSPANAKAKPVTIGVEQVTAVSAVLKGKVTMNSSSASKMKLGFQYSTSAVILPSTSTMIEVDEADENYNFAALINGLEPTTTYYFRSFVHQNDTYTYGETKSFKTLEIVIAIETLEASEINSTSATLNARLDINDVSYTDLEYGFYWGTTETSQDTKIVGGEITNNAYSASLTDLAAKTQYWLKAYVKIDGQISYGEVKTFTTEEESVLAPIVTIGADHVSAISAVLMGKANFGSTVASDFNVGFQYSKSAGILPSNSTAVEAEDADADFNYTTGISGLDPATTYYFRSFIRQNGQDTYGETKSFTTKDVASLLETKDASSVEAASAVLNAKLDLTDVQYKSLAYGFLWGNSEATVSTDIKGTEIVEDAFSVSLTGLAHKTPYWYKAYVNLDSRAFFGEVKTFTTEVIPVESVSLDKDNYTFNTIGNSITLNATVIPEDATDKSIEWSSDKEDVVSVDQNGNLTAMDNGKATITVTSKDQGKTATCEVTVAQSVTGITLNQTYISLNEGQTADLSVGTITPSNAYDKSVRWASSNKKIATVDENGKVTAISIGTATINAIANGGSGVVAAHCRVLVRNLGPIPSGAVDLGLNVYWASCNLGMSRFVSSPETYGPSFAWGETDTKSSYTWSTYKFGTSADGPFSKYNTDSSYGPVDTLTVLETGPNGDDVASKKLGGKWRIPTINDWNELRSMCTITLTDNHNGTGVAGIIVTSMVDGYKDNSIFLPAAGYRATSLNKAGSNGYYWSSSLYSTSCNAWYIYFNPDNVFGIYGTSRYFGFPIRPVSE